MRHILRVLVLLCQTAAFLFTLAVLPIAVVFYLIVDDDDC